MNKYRMFAVIAVLVLASLACQAVTGLGGGGNGNGNDLPPTTSDDSSPTDAPSVSDSGNTNEGESSSDSKFPMTEDAYNVTDAAGTLLYYTKMSGDDVMKFYRDTYTAQGYTERELLTVVSGGVFSMVFDGDPSGKAVVIQSVDMGDGSRTVAIRLEDV
ncbi:MAG: hypothetical protein IPP66_17430 [Anaerolineales bacterium]|nr:hypothetical protein [Anaerolineales bacterium]